MRVPDAEIDEVQAMFDRIDSDSDGYISFDEFAKLVLGMGSTRPESALRASFEAIDGDRNGRVTIGECRAWMSFQR